MGPFERYPLPMKPERIVSLVPSLTEALFSLGVGSRVVGRTRYCTQPPRAIGRVAKVGGTKKVDAEHVLGLEPDLVVAVKEENTRADIEGLKEAGVPVFVGAPETIDAALEMLRELAGRVGAAEDVAEAMLGPIERVYRRLRQEPGTTIRKEIVVDLYAIEKKRSEDLALAPNDIIDVPTSAGKSFLRSLIQGVVPGVGQLPVRVVP